MAKEPATIDRPKLVANMLGNPKKVLALDGDTARHLVGTIFGVAEKVKSKVSQDAAGTPQVYDQIVGDFEGIPAEPLDDGDGTPVKSFRSGILYLPAGIHERISEQLKRDGAQPIQFAIELYTFKTKNPAGYSWEAKALLPPAVNDPMDQLRQAIAATGKSKALPAPSPKKAA